MQMEGRPGTGAGEGALLDRLRDLLDGAAGSGGTLPGEPSLAAMLGASRPALREALTRLEAEGLVSRRRGAGTTVNVRARTITSRFDQQVEFADVIARSGREPGLELLGWSVGPVDAETAAAIGCGTDHHGLRTVKRWTADGEPVLVAVDVVPFAVGDERRVTVPPGVDPSASVFANAEAVSGAPVEWEIARPSAAVLEGELAAWFGDRTGALLVLDLLGVARTGLPLYHAVEYHLPGVLEFGFVRTIDR